MSTECGRPSRPCRLSEAERLGSLFSTFSRTSAMPPIRRALTFLSFILLFFVVLHFPSHQVRRIFSQNAGLYSSSYTGISRSHESQFDPSTSTSTQVETSIPGSELVTGFALLDRLYLRNGTFFIVTANQSAFPPRRNIISPGMDMGAGHDMEPTDKVLICSVRVPYQKYKLYSPGTSVYRPGRRGEGAWTKCDPNRRVFGCSL
jgi:hypothetical protein